MKSTVTKRCFLVLVLANCLTGFGQIGESRGFHVSMSMPTGILNSMLNAGKGIGVNINSAYFYQVRSRLSGNLSTNKSSGVGYSTQVYDFNLGETKNVFLICERMVSLNGGAGLDYKLLPNMLPAFYCGPEMIVGVDYAQIYYSNSNSNLGIGSGLDRFVHGGFRFNFGLEKKIGKVDVFGEYAFSRMWAQNYDYQYSEYYGPDKTLNCKFFSQKLTFGIRF
jgi:hypothetical protein